jgi:hypothetical protein
MDERYYKAIITLGIAVTLGLEIYIQFFSDATYLEKWLIGLSNTSLIINLALCYQPLNK